MAKYHLISDTKRGIVLKKDGSWVQTIIIPSSWENKYHIITEGVETGCALHEVMSKEQIKKYFDYDM